MQFRDAKGVVQVLAYRGYDKTKKRAVVKLLGSFDRHSYVMTDALKANATAEEMAEITAHIEKIRQLSSDRVRLDALSSLSSRILEVRDSIASGAVDSTAVNEHACKILEACEALKAAIRKIRPKSPRKAKVKVSPPKSEDEPELPLGLT